jgi:dCMP deaminase
LRELWWNRVGSKETLPQWPPPWRSGDITVGYDGFPMGVEDSTERLQDANTKLDMIVHAEVNAIIAAALRAQGSTIYVWGKPVFARCAGSIIQSDVTRVVSPSADSVAIRSKWRKTGEIAFQMFREAGKLISMLQNSKVHELVGSQDCQLDARPVDNTTE